MPNRSIVSAIAIIIVLTTVTFTQVACDVTDKTHKKIPDQISGVPIRLQARTFVPTAGIDPELQKIAQESTIDGALHVIVQLTRNPTQQDMRALREKYGITLLDAIPEKAYFASVSPNLIVKGKLPDYRGNGEKQLLHSMVAYRAADKIQPRLLKGDISPHALLDESGKPNQEKGSHAAVVVLFFPNVTVNKQNKWLEEIGAKIRGYAQPINAYDLMIAKDRLAELGKHDGVKWVEEIPGPIELDNDGVRSALGVNADAVDTTSLFGLSGTGITIAQWESTNASSGHTDLAGNITIADAPIPNWTRTWMHADPAPANNVFDLGEAIYVDFDDSATVTVGDQRITATGAFVAGSTVAGGNADIGTAIILFQNLETFGDATADNLFNPADPVYLNNDGNGSVSIGDTRITATGGFAAGSIVAAGDADIGTDLDLFPTNPHYHSTHVAGTIVGTGVQSAANGGGANQWKGVASGAALISYNVFDRTTTTELAPEYTDAVNVRGVTISSNSWGSSHCHQENPPQNCYNVVAQLYDTLVSGRLSTGAASTYTQRISIFGSSGNRGRAERHAENVTVNGQYDNGETIYIDNDMSGTFTAGDLLRTGPAQAAGTALIDFQANERHNDGTNGLWNSTETIYRDTDNSLSVTTGDTRLTVPAGSAFAAGSVVAAADADVGTFLRQFRLWGNTRIPNSAKNTIVVGNVTNDGNQASASSSRGPTTDGRLKPDIAAPGSQNGGDTGVTSTYPRNQYFTTTGTSMSTPATAGATALLEEWYADSCTSGAPKPSTIKAIMLHSAADVTQIPTIGVGYTGPDFVYGYGMAKVDQAVALIPHHIEGSLAATGNVSTSTITIGTVQDLKVTLAWDDVPWNIAAASSPVTGLLVNDLDLEVVAPDGTVYTPWQINAATPATPSVAGPGYASAVPIPAIARDRRNTVEQVVVTNAMPGTWTLRVVASNLTQPSQDFSLVNDFIQPQSGPCNSAPATDVMMRDNSSDINGSIPSVGTMWLSPDVWNRMMSDGMTGHQNPEFGQPNYLYMNLRNLSVTETAEATSMDVWLAPASTGLSWPDDFSYVGRHTVPNMGAASIRQVGPLQWNPPNPMPSDHFCFYVRVVNPQDPVTFAEVSSVGTNARNSNNLVWRNINVVDILSTTSVTFLARNLSGDDADIDIELSIPDELLQDGTVGIALSETLMDSWQRNKGKSEGLSAKKVIRVANVPGLPALDDPELAEVPGEPKTYPYKVTRVTNSKAAFRGIRLQGRQDGAITLAFSSAIKQKKIYTVDVVQRQNGKIVGGIRYLVRTGYKSGR
jgi:hypothetical protein